MNLTLLALIASSSTATAEWNPYACLIMISCNVFALVVGRLFIQQQGYGPAFPVPEKELVPDFGFPELLASMSFGHILGTGMILGFSQAGLL